MGKTALDKLLERSPQYIDDFIDYNFMICDLVKNNIKNEKELNHFKVLMNVKSDEKFNKLLSGLHDFTLKEICKICDFCGKSIKITSKHKPK